MEKCLIFTAIADNVQYRLLRNKWTSLFYIYGDFSLTKGQNLVFLNYVLHGNKLLKHAYEAHTLGLIIWDIDRLWNTRI